MVLSGCFQGNANHFIIRPDWLYAHFYRNTQNKNHPAAPSSLFKTSVPTQSLRTYLRWVDFLRNCGAASVVVLQDNLFLSTDDDVNCPFYNLFYILQAFEQE